MTVTIQTILSDIDRLTPVPWIVNQVMAKVEEPNSDLRDIADVIAHDPLMTAEIIRMCNSAYFGLPRAIESVHDAIALLGLDQVVDLVLLQSGAKDLAQTHTGYGLNENDLWRSAVLSAMIARDLAPKMGIDQVHLLFTAALLKDIGKVILDRHIVGVFERINQLVCEEKFSFREAEKKIIGIDHAELGAIVAKQWRFSPRLVHLIRHHHPEDETTRQDPMIAAIHLADMMTLMMGIGLGADGLAYRFYEDILNHFAISARDMELLILGSAEKLEKVDALIRKA